MFNLLARKEESSLKLNLKQKANGDFLTLIREKPELFADLEHSINHKEVDEILNEIQLGLRINNLSQDDLVVIKKPVVIIPPKYEMWLYFLLAIRLSHIGNKVIFLHHNWSNALIDSIKPTLSYLKYQNLTLHNAEDYTFPVHDVFILNFSDSYKGIKSNVPAYSTLVVDKNSDLDYVMAYVFANAFSFAGMKKSNVKRIIIEESLREDFERKINSRLSAVNDINAAKIRSKRLKTQIHEIVSEAISEGADLLVGGDDFEVDNYKNIILNNVTHDMRVYQKNFFGPVLQLLYTSYDPKSLAKVIRQQPSKGIVIFTDDNKFIDLHRSCFKNKSIVVRPFVNQTKLAGIIEYNPTLESMFKLIDIEI